MPAIANAAMPARAQRHLATTHAAACPGFCRE